MTDRTQDFDLFLRNWIAERIGELGDRTDPSDLEFMCKRRARELNELAKENAFRSNLSEITRGDVVGFVRQLYRNAENSRKGY